MIIPQVNPSFNGRKDQFNLNKVIKNNPLVKALNICKQNIVLVPKFLKKNNKLLRQAKMVEEAEKYQKERNKIMADNRDLHKQVDDIKAEYKEKDSYRRLQDTFYQYMTSHNFEFSKL